MANHIHLFSHHQFEVLKQRDFESSLISINQTIQVFFVGVIN